MATAPLSRLSAEEYLVQERRSAERHEFLGGEVFAMTGASRRHNLVAGNVFAALHAQLAGRGCEVYTHDMRVRASAADLFATRTWWSPADRSSPTPRPIRW